MRKLSLKVNAKYYIKTLMWIIIFLAYLKPDYLGTMEIFDLTFNIIRVLFLASVCYKIFTSHRISKDRVACLAYTAIPFLVTIINGGDIYSSLIAIIIIFSSYCMFDRDSYDHFIFKLNILSSVLTVLIIIDVVTIFLYPDGLYKFRGAHDIVFYTSDVWFLGFKNNHTPYLILACFTSAIYASFTHRREAVARMIIAHIISVIIVLKMNAGMGIVSFFIYFVLLLVFIHKGKKFPFHFGISVFIHLIGMIALTAFSISTVFGSIFALIGKNGTASNRIYIWAEIWNRIFQSPIWGHGYMKSSDLLWLQNIAAGATTSHNTFLDMIFRGGLITVICFCVFLFLVSKKNNRLMKVNLHLYNYFSLIFFVMLLTAQAEGFMLAIPIYLILAIYKTVSQFYQQKDKCIIKK